VEAVKPQRKRSRRTRIRKLTSREKYSIISFRTVLEGRPPYSYLWVKP
jgi:hypothetical protein